LIIPEHADPLKVKPQLLVTPVKNSGILSVLDLSKGGTIQTVLLAQIETL